ncbi:hypothetical protein HOR39_gp12 [Staphylococcus phage SCH1]|uniref:Uncharacterized protein n=3 Tax=Rosenblumvirus SCH1 TaxID=2732604 RepID=A0A5B8R6V5_9CAUD|nr:hypothetical protein HOR39_gp12 [Staphylococcus phage SCH1]APD20938.1 hypothetical protein [Staphylococcus phage SCH1]APD20960.1 hypothetical protein [Staphylococcus phage SCH111]QEA03125.1 hypothetical protein [Staphylococcus phage vB_SauP-436A1]
MMFAKMIIQNINNFLAKPFIDFLDHRLLFLIALAKPVTTSTIIKTNKKYSNFKSPAYMNM